MKYIELHKVCKAHVVSLFTENKDKTLKFHSLDHTKRVIERAWQILSFYSLSEREHFVVATAAWFHDVAYILEESVTNKDSAADMASSILLELNVDEQTISEVVGCILATSMPQYPTNLLESILCDASQFHLGTTEFFARDALMHAEYELKLGHQIPIEMWLEKTIQKLEAHQFHTYYCRSLLEMNKQGNLNRLRARLAEV